MVVVQKKMVLVVLWMMVVLHVNQMNAAIVTIRVAEVRINAVAMLIHVHVIRTGCAVKIQTAVSVDQMIHVVVKQVQNYVPVVE